MRQLWWHLRSSNEYNPIHVPTNWTSPFGREGAVHRSHALVGAVTGGVAVDDLSDHDLAYAPPFNTTWDPVLTAAKVVDGKR
jgi:hypothetical protein